MIFCTVGTQLPFDRLLKKVDKAAASLNDIEFFAQISTSKYHPKAMNWKRDLSEEEFDELMTRSELVISHAGMGTIISSLDKSVPLIVLPREYSLGEHRNDHQVSTCNKFSHFENITILKDSDDIIEVISTLLKTNIESTDKSNLSFPIAIKKLVDATLIKNKGKNG